LDNGNPLDLIFSPSEDYTRGYYKSLKLSQTTNLLNTSRKIYFTIPYISSIAKKFIQYFKNISFCKLVFTCYSKLNKFIKVHKDSLPTASRPNIVCKMNYLKCDASYVGQTKRTLNTRISEQRSHIRRDSAQSSVITNHRSEFGHDFDWDRMKMLDEELNFNKRFISEMIQYKKAKI